MPTSQEILSDNARAYQDKQESYTEEQQAYKGPIIYRGYKINRKHSPNRVVDTLRGSLNRSQFAALQAIGIPGSGKTQGVVNIITELVEREIKENNQVYNVSWKGAEDLRHLDDIIDEIPKGSNQILVFDDVSDALKKLNASEQSEIFEKLTTTRHVTGGRLLIISIFHYTYSNEKKVGAQSVVTIYFSATMREVSNILQFLPSQKGRRVFRKFQRCYQDCVNPRKRAFELELFPGGKPVTFPDGQPFRPMFVINMFRPHIGLFMKLDNAFQPPENIKQNISSKALIEKLSKAYTHEEARLILRLICMIKGYKFAMRTKSVCCWKFVMENLAKDYNIKWGEIAELVKDPKQKNLYRKRSQEKILKDEILRETKEAPPETTTI